MDLLTVAEVAAFLRVPVATVRAWRYRGEGPPVLKVGRALRYRRDELEAWLAEGREEGPHAA